MEPNQQPSFEPSPEPIMQPGAAPLDPGAKMIKRGLIGFAIIVVLGLAWVAWLSFQASRFHTVSTNPDINSVNTISPFIKVTFNQTLSKDGIKVTSNQGIVTSTSVDGKTLTINLKTPMDQTQEYQITINSIKDTLGDHMSNKTFTFTPQYVAPKDVPKDQQQTQLQEQANKPYDLTYMVFNGTDNFLTLGVTSDQLNNMKQAFLQYFTSINQKIYTINITPSSISKVPRDPESDSMANTINFTGSFADNNYAFKARLDYSDLSSARLYLYDGKSGAQIYDSSTINLYH